jgi:type VI secretion system protein ImpA
VRLLDESIRWLRAHEPSSPVPLLLERAKRLMAKDFLEILQDLAGDSVAQAEKILAPEGGASADKSAGKKK